MFFIKPYKYLNKDTGKCERYPSNSYEKQIALYTTYE